MAIHPRDPAMTGTYFASLAELHEAGGRILTIDEQPSPVGVASDSVRLCWACESEIALVEHDHMRLVLQHRDGPGAGLSWARFCGRDCWEEWADPSN